MVILSVTSSKINQLKMGTCKIREGSSRRKGSIFGNSLDSTLWLRKASKYRSTCCQKVLQFVTMPIIKGNFSLPFLNSSPSYDTS